ncbi:hypothetical protein PR048_014028 [Dryococelus australis]|uniref:Uncharacterized protein n=1 Tax=Dryococelus australis TaxID=614101 RepID=A0ABQ9HU50_9NEOP|nr:hypothetical protein PR048_014028 [Dryococelus australis]
MHSWFPSSYRLRCLHNALKLSSSPLNVFVKTVAIRINTDVNHDGQGCESHLKPELCKALLSLLYLFVVTWITAFVMVIVHDRVPDMKRYPPLPDIFLDNVPPIPWAFKMCEWTGTVLFLILVGVLLFHKHSEHMDPTIALQASKIVLGTIQVVQPLLSSDPPRIYCHKFAAYDDETQQSVAAKAPEGTGHLQVHCPHCIDARQGAALNLTGSASVLKLESALAYHRGEEGTGSTEGIFALSHFSMASHGVLTMP